MDSFLESTSKAKLYIEASLFKDRVKIPPSDVRDLVDKFKQQFPNDWGLQRDTRTQVIWGFLKSTNEPVFKYDYEDMVLYSDQKDIYRIIRGRDQFRV